MGGASSYLAILSIAGFLTAAWLATKISRFCGVSSIVLEITTGVLLGPSVLGLVAREYAECQHAHHIDCSPPDNLEQLILDDKPLGEGLGMVQHMDLCHKADYFSGGHSGGEHADEEHGSHSGAASHSSDAAAHESTGEMTEDAHGDHGDHAESGHESGHESSNESGHESGNESGHERRLSGGGNYATYDECLVKSCQAEVSHKCGLTPDFFTLIGHTGVAMMIFESGMHFDFEQAAIVGPRACVVAVFGTVTPFVSGALLTMLFGRPLMPDGLSVGTALAPTSVGIALRLLGEAKVLQEEFGQAIITAAFVDDILSLILFNVLFSLRGDFDVVPVVIFPCIGVAFMAAAMWAAVKVWPVLINEKLLPRIPEEPNSKFSKRDEALFLIMMVVLVAYATFTHFLGTHLWGCFMAGMSFACLGGHHAHHVWVTQTKRATSWMIRIFFAATVAFSIPFDKLLSLDAFLKGSLMGIGPCIATKVLCAPFMGPARWVIGWAMVGRAEFAYLIAQMAAAGNMMDTATFSIVIWALLYATIFAPFIFRKVLDRYVAQYCQDAVEKKLSEIEEAKSQGIELDEIDLDAHERN